MTKIGSLSSMIKKYDYCPKKDLLLVNCTHYLYN